MLGKDSCNFTRGFRWIGYVHGQKGDPGITLPELPIHVPAQPHKIKKIDSLVSYVLNHHNRSYEREYCVGRTISSAADWLEPNNSHRSLFLWIDMWNPHDPFDCPCYGFELYGDSGPKDSGPRAPLARINSIVL